MSSDSGLAETQACPPKLSSREFVSKEWLPTSPIDVERGGLARQQPVHREPIQIPLKRRQDYMYTRLF
jgi:hypothetical protein